MRSLKQLFLVIPLVINGQLLNESLLVENYNSHDLSVSQDGRFALTYQRMWEHGWGGLEPIIDSSHIYLTQLDSLANPIGELWFLRDDSVTHRWSPQVSRNDDNLLWLYFKGANGGRRFVSQSSATPGFPDGNELVLVDSLAGDLIPSSLELLNGQFLFFWIDYSSGGTSPLIWGQRINKINEPVGDHFQLFNEDSILFVGFPDNRILAATNSIANQSYLAWVEWIFDESNPLFYVQSNLYVLELQADGTPQGNPHIIFNFHGEMNIKNLFIRDDGELVISYSTQSDFENQSLWLHSVSDEGEPSEVATVTQLPEFSKHHSLYFPQAGPGVSIYLSENKDSLKVQRLNPGGEMIGGLEFIPFNNHFFYPTIESILIDQKLIIFESSIYNALYAHVFAFDNYTAIEPPALALPVTPSLAASYPNPFNPSTIVKFTLPHQAEVSIKIYNVLGHEVATVVQSRLPAGIHKISWDANDQAAGIYFCRMETQHFSQVRKLTLVK